MLPAGPTTPFSSHNFSPGSMKLCTSLRESKSKILVANHGSEKKYILQIT